MLKQSRLTFADVFYQRHRSHLLRVGRRAATYLAVSATMALLFVLAWLHHRVSAVEAALLLGIFLWVLGGIALGLPKAFQVRVLPYFERRLDDIDTWTSGQALLANSRQLDQLALCLGATPLSHFASGDDLVPGETLTWFDPAPAWETTDKLLASEAARTFAPELTSDLSRLRAALKTASDQHVRFCLLLREGSSSSDAEMGRRKGSFH